MGTAVVRVIAFAGIVIGMKPSLAGAHAAFAALARAIRPARDFIGTDGIMAATVLGIISFAAFFKRMQPGSACIGNACFIYTCSGFPAFHLIGTFYPMLATVVRAVFLADHVVMMFIGFAVCGAAAAVKACFGIFTCNKIFAVFICAAELVGCLRVNACAATAHIAFGFTCRFFAVVVTSNDAQEGGDG